jgi:hypothetical protein
LYADSYLAIDQGPIINMIENQRSGLLWNSFMGNQEIQTALKKIGFTPDLSTGVTNLKPDVLQIKVQPNPLKNTIHLTFVQPKSESVTIELVDSAGRFVQHLLAPTRLNIGTQHHQFRLSSLPSGTYFLQISSPTYKTAYPLIISQ